MSISVFLERKTHILQARSLQVSIPCISSTKTFIYYKTASSMLESY